MLLLFVMSACSKQKEPTVTLVNGRFFTTNVDISPGGIVMFKWIAEKGKSDLTSFNIQIDGVDLYGFPNDSIPADIYFDSTPPMEGPVAEGDYAFSFVATDLDGNIGFKTLVVTVQ